jgi:predicted dehydrogenase/aryl-alcohol dehydrogenase-like predicted oxidoreductase
MASRTLNRPSGPSELRWGLIGTGAIAKAFAHGLTQVDAGQITAVGSRSAENARKFADANDLPGATCHGSYKDLLADDNVDAVYVATPHPMHAPWAIKAAEAGKHVLVEKPMALNHAEAQQMIEAAREMGVFLMEAFMYRCHPQTAKLVELLQQKVIGDVRMVRASFGFKGPDGTEGRLNDPMLAGGGIMDVGCYPASFSRLVASVVTGRSAATPDDLQASGVVQDGVDHVAAATLRFDHEQGPPVVAQIATSIRAGLDNTATIFGSGGRIDVPNPWTADRNGGGEFKIVVHAGGQRTEHTGSTDATAFGIEARLAAEAIVAGKQQADGPAMTWDDSLGNAKTLDQWRAKVGVTYPHETGEHSRPAAGRKPAPQPRPGRPEMRFGRVQGLDRDVSVMVMGCDNKNSLAEAAPVWDHWIEVGGNTFDTAWVYGRKKQQIMGQWLKNRGLTEYVNLICKGAHTPHCNPEGITRELHQSLEDFGLDQVPIYIMHRDNPDVPVGEFIDVLDEHARAGRIGVVGGSNWSIDRFQAANAYAKANGKQGMSLLNNNLSLARMVTPVWGGCVSASDPESLAYLEKTGTANFSWSSQARGYFVSRDATGMIVGGQNNWDSPDNQKRRERAFELAEKYDVSALNIAAAYVLCQPFPSFALIGPRTINEITTSLPGLSVQLSTDELAYLDLRTDDAPS